MKNAPLLPLLALALLPAACRPRGLSFEQFVTATAELRVAANETRTPAAFEARKRQIEAKLGVTDAQLTAFVRQHSGDVQLLSAAWDSVEARVGRAGTRDAATHPVPQPAASPGANAPTLGKPPAAGGVRPGAVPGATGAAGTRGGTPPPPAARPSNAIRF